MIGYSTELYMDIRVVPRMAIFGQGHPRIFPQRANERVLPTDFRSGVRSAIIFFLAFICAFSIAMKVFKNQRSDPSVKKNRKKG